MHAQLSSYYLGALLVESVANFYLCSTTCPDFSLRIHFFRLFKNCREEEFLTLVNFLICDPGTQPFTE